MPTKDCIRREQRADFLKPLSSEHFAFDGESATLVIVEQDPLLAMQFFDDLALGPQIVDHLLLFPVNPAG